MFTPAQKPRGLARMILKREPPFQCPYRTEAAANRQAKPQQTTSPPRRVAMPAHPESRRDRSRTYLSFFSSYSSLLTLIVFLPSFSETVPVTVPFLGVLQMSGWYCVWLSDAK